MSSEHESSVVQLERRLCSRVRFTIFVPPHSSRYLPSQHALFYRASWAVYIFRCFKNETAPIIYFTDPMDFFSGDGHNFSRYRDRIILGASARQNFSCTFFSLGQQLLEICACMLNGVQIFTIIRAPIPKTFNRRQKLSCFLIIL